MENIYEKVVKLTAEILKSWTPNPGVVSPFSSSSSQHSEESDNHLEYYVKKPSIVETVDISSMFNSDLFTNGGEKMTDKVLDVNTSTTTEQQYDNPGASTTEPDAQSKIAITKSAEMQPTTVGTTANTTEQAPSSGDTTEPTVQKGMASCPTCGGGSCPDCNKSLSLCNCAGMTKDAKDGDPVPAGSDGSDEISKAAESEETPADEAKETPEEEAAEAKQGKEEPLKKSSPLWNGAFAPVKP